MSEESDTPVGQQPQEVKWTDCYICRDSFGRKRVTSRYCSKCGKGFCESEHGSMTVGGVGLCLFCRYQIGPSKPKS
jgi:hypothetical protein